MDTDPNPTRGRVWSGLVGTKEEEGPSDQYPVIKSSFSWSWLLESKMRGGPSPVRAGS